MQRLSISGYSDDLIEVELKPEHTHPVRLRVIDAEREMDNTVGPSATKAAEEFSVPEGVAILRLSVTNPDGVVAPLAIVTAGYVGEGTWVLGAGPAADEDTPVDTPFSQLTVEIKQHPETPYAADLRMLLPDGLVTLERIVS
jgi:hypothetical protein